MPAYAVEFAAEAERDFELIFDFLQESYQSFGESAEDAIAHAARRIEAIRATAARLGSAPYRGTLHPEMMPDLRHVTTDQAICWFFVDEDARIIRVLAIFFGGQDHVRQMLARLLLCWTVSQCSPIGTGCAFTLRYQRISHDRSFPRG